MAVSLLVVVLTAVLTILPWGGQGWERQTTQSNGQQHARIAMEELVNELLYAYRIEVNPVMGMITYYKENRGDLQRYRVYLLGEQLLLDLPEGTAVPLASCIEGIILHPAGTLYPGDVLTLTLQVNQQVRHEVRTAVVAKNLTGEAL